MISARLVLAAAAALALTSGAAFAGSGARTARNTMPVSMDRTVGGTTVLGGAPSAPTIWGHAVSRSVYEFEDRGPHDQAGGR